MLLSVLEGLFVGICLVTRADAPSGSLQLLAENRNTSIPTAFQPRRRRARAML